MSTNPNTVKSQDDTTEDELGRTMTLLRAIEQLEKTECKLERTKKQLDIAVKGIKAVLDDELFFEIADGGLIMYLYTALERIEELNKCEK